MEQRRRRAEAATQPPGAAAQPLPEASSTFDAFGTRPRSTDSPGNSPFGGLSGGGPSSGSETNSPGTGSFGGLSGGGPSSGSGANSAGTGSPARGFGDGRFGTGEFQASSFGAGRDFGEDSAARPLEGPRRSPGSGPSGLPGEAPDARPPASHPGGSPRTDPFQADTGAQARDPFATWAAPAAPAEPGQENAFTARQAPSRPFAESRTDRHFQEQRTGSSDSLRTPTDPFQVVRRPKEPATGTGPFAAPTPTETTRTPGAAFGAPAAGPRRDTGGTGLGDPATTGPWSGTGPGSSATTGPRAGTGFAGFGEPSPTGTRGDTAASGSSGRRRDTAASSTAAGGLFGRRGETAAGGTSGRRSETAAGGTSGRRGDAGDAQPPMREYHSEPEEPRRRSKLPLILTGCVAALLVAGGGAVILTSGADTPTPPASTPRPAGQVPLVVGADNKNGYTASRKTDPQPLTLNELFGRKKITVKGRSYRMTVRRTDKKCKDAVHGDTLQKALTSGGCTQLLRASYRDSSSTLIGTVGVANLRTSAAATKAAKTGRGGELEDYVNPLQGKDPATKLLGSGTDSYAIAWSQGHYLILLWFQYKDGHKPTKTELKRLNRAAVDITEATIFPALDTRALTGARAT